MKQKLTSRKFWAAAVGFIAPLIYVLGGSSDLVSDVTALIMSGASVIAYIICEGAADCARVRKEHKDD